MTPDAPAAEPPSSVYRFARRVIDVRPGELGVALLSALCFFCVLASYFVLRPVREEIGIARGMDKLPLLWTGTLGVTLLLAPLFAWLVGKYPRRVFLPTTYRFFAANLVVFAVLSKTLSGTPLLWSRYAFYFWLSAFNMFVVSVFWAFMADVFRLEQSRRLFGFIGVGGTIGALAGAKFTETFSGRVNTYVLMAASVVLLEVAAQLVRLLGKRTVETAKEPVSSRRASGGAWDGFKLVLASPYMRVIAVYILMQTLVAAALNLELNQLVSDAKSSAAERTAAFANRDFYTQLATLALQLFVTGRLIPWLGVKRTLVIQPFLTLAGFVLLAWVLPPSPEPGSGFVAEREALEFALWTVIGFQAVFSATQNAFARPARETMFTVVTRDEKYKAKSFIDTPLLRGGDVLFGYVFQTGLRDALKLPGSLISALVVPFAGVWIAVSWLCGRAQERRAGGHDVAR